MVGHDHPGNRVLGRATDVIFGQTIRSRRPVAAPSMLCSPLVFVVNTVKGMVAVAGRIYRILRLSQGEYSVVRILDDASIGSFRTIPEVEILFSIIDMDLMRSIVKAAIHGKKTSWVGRLNF